MRRKYAVYIGGKKVIITAPDPAANDAVDGARATVTDSKSLKEAMQLLDLPEVNMLTLEHEDVDRLWALFRSRYAFVQAAGGTVTDERGRLLVMYRRGMWDLPKGKVDKGEAIPEAAIREVMEECGLGRVEIVGRNGSGSQQVLAETWHVYEHKGDRVLKRTDWFLMRASSKEELVAQAEEDITEVKWMSDTEVLSMRAITYPTLHAVIDAWRRAMAKG